MPFIYIALLLATGGTGWLLGRGVREAGAGVNDAGEGAAKAALALGAVGVALLCWNLAGTRRKGT